MNFTSILQKSSRKVVRTLPFKKSSVLLSISLTLVFFLSLSSLGNADVGNTDSLSSIAQTADTDGDGLSDDLEDALRTEKDNKFGDKDNDGLYDFEEFLDIYGNNNTDNPKYNYNDSTTHGSVLDIYRYFNLSSNKTGYLRDQNFTEENGGFTDYLLWNISFSRGYSGGSVTGSVNYSYNIMRDVSFSESGSGGSFSGSVSYSSNVLTNVNFTGEQSGGSGHGSVSYSSNVLTNVNFTDVDSGGSLRGDISYSNNTMIDVSFTGFRSGGSRNGAVSYSNNRMTNVSFSGHNGGSYQGGVSYSSNVLTNVNFTGSRSGGGYNGTLSYNNNTLTNVNFSGEFSGGNEQGTITYSHNTMRDVSFSGNYSGGSINGDVNYRMNTISNILLSGNDACTSKNGDSIYTDNVIVNDSYDTDGDGLGDGHELLESGTNPRSKEGSSLSSFTLLTTLGIFTSFGLVLVVCRVRRRIL